MRNNPEVLAHCQRISLLASLLAKFYGCSNSEVNAISIAASDHDIGKNLVPRKILLKPARLNRREYSVMKSHVLTGLFLVKRVKKLSRKVILEHHERWDGRGYPFKKKKEEISFPSRVVALADVFGALTKERVYKDAYSPESSIEIMEKDDGHFDPKLFDIFLKNKEEFIALSVATI